MAGVGVGGIGGGSFFGGGARTTVGLVGPAGQNYGGAGAGSANNGELGGAGAGGVVVVEY
jgi:hypothetical protein